MEELLREAFQLGQQWLQDMNNDKEPINFNDWYNSDETQNKLKKISQHDIMSELPKYSKKGDYCAVCGGDEFWSDEEE